MAGKKLALGPKEDVKEESEPDKCPKHQVKLIRTEGCKTCPICEYSLCVG